MEEEKDPRTPEECKRLPRKPVDRPSDEGQPPGTLHSPKGQGGAC
jgi:hypothetical protein